MADPGPSTRSPAVDPPSEPADDGGTSAPPSVLSEVQVSCEVSIAAFDVLTLPAAAIINLVVNRTGSDYNDGDDTPMFECLPSPEVALEYLHAELFGPDANAAVWFPVSDGTAGYLPDDGARLVSEFKVAKVPAHMVETLFEPDVIQPSGEDGIGTGAGLDALSNALFGGGGAGPAAISAVARPRPRVHFAFRFHHTGSDGRVGAATKFVPVSTDRHGFFVVAETNPYPDYVQHERLHLEVYNDVLSMWGTAFETSGPPSLQITWVEAAVQTFVDAESYENEKLVASLRDRLLLPYSAPRTAHGLKRPRGVLFLGAPGAGKTAVARMLKDEVGFRPIWFGSAPELSGKVGRVYRCLAGGV